MPFYAQIFIGKIPKTKIKSIGKIPDAEVLRKHLSIKKFRELMLLKRTRNGQKLALCPLAKTGSAEKHFSW